MSVFLESRYRKLVRGLPQTVLFCPRCKGGRRQRKKCGTCAGRGRLSDDSVQQIFARTVLPAFGAKAGKFHGAGREDVDVLMLGAGRPFVFEVCRPTRALAEVDLAALGEALRVAAEGRVEFAPLQPSTRARVVFWKQTAFEKTYRAVVSLGPNAGRPETADPPQTGELASVVAPALAAVPVGRRLAIEQRTPQRVAHRRTDLVRPRWVEVLSLAAPTPAELEVVLRCAHGTYVKEWISGDEGRTTPSLAGMLGVAATCAVLDVLEVVAI